MSQKLIWARAVWREGEKLMEDVVPLKWTNADSLFWPVGISFQRALSKQLEPAENWKKFPLIKIKLQSGKIFFA